jgi:hypothetical protein
MIIVRLSEAIYDGARRIAEIRIHPAGLVPQRIGGEAVIDAAALARSIAGSAGIAPATVAKLPAIDLFAVALALREPAPKGRK